MHQRWIGDEGRMTLVARRAVLRALRRPVRVLAISLLATGALVALRMLKAPTYTATLHYRLAEGDLTEPGNAPRPPSDIRQYIYNVALSREPLERIMTKFRRSGSWLARDPVAAIEQFRSEIQIEVARDYFIFSRLPGDTPRSAQVTISVEGPEPEQTRAMLQDIGDAILLDQRRHCSGGLARAHEHLHAEAKVTRARMKVVEEVASRLATEGASADEKGAATARVRLAAVRAELRSLQERAQMLDRRAADLAFSAAAEEEQLGLRFEFVDENLVTSSPRLTPFQVVRFTVVAFAVVLLLAVPVMGAFDDRVYEAQDLAARGLPIFGALPAFPGDEVGSYRARKTG